MPSEDELKEYKELYEAFDQDDKGEVRGEFHSSIVPV